MRRLPDTSARVQQELRLLMALSAPLQATRGYGAAEVGEVCGRARALCERLGESVALFGVLWRLGLFFVLNRAEWRAGGELAEQCQRLAEGAGDPGLLVAAHLLQGERGRAQAQAAGYQPEAAAGQ